MQATQSGLNLLSLEEASAAVRSLSGYYPVCVVTSPKGAKIIKPILERCNYRLNLIEVKLMVDEGCKDDALYFLPERELKRFMKASGRTA